MTAKRKKTQNKAAKKRKARAQSRRQPRSQSRSSPATIPWLRASVEDDLLSLAEDGAGEDSRWNRPRKRRISLRVDVEVVDWLKSLGPGYQTRINRILRRVMMEGKGRAGGK